MNFAGIDHDNDDGGVANVRDQGRVTTPYLSIYENKKEMKTSNQSFKRQKLLD